jgi:transcriptional regulator with XRE-family HTH domain
MHPQHTPRFNTKRARFPNAIREYRLKAGLTQKKLGELIGRSRRAISNWECGVILPRVPDLFRLAKALATLAETLYAGLYCTYPREKTANPSEA